jgi:prepilin-type processing-associated H-X9-DG protein
MDEPPPPHTNLLAGLSLVLGLLALPTCGATAPFALLFGFLALRRVNLSDGRLPGGRAAKLGMVLGAAGVVLFFAGLFVVGLGRLRGKSEVTVCTNNLRRIGQAVNLYHDEEQHRNFPPGTIRNSELPPDRRLSWMVAILPYMEAEPTPGPASAKAQATFHKGVELYDRFNRADAWDAEENRRAMSGSQPWFVCPAALPRPAAGEPTLTQYVGIAGLGADAAQLPRTDPRAGFFGYDRIIDRDDVTRGTEQTMMVSERANAVGPWAAGGPATVAGLDPRKQPFVPEQFGGLHPHGANALFADGHVTFISDRADPRVWEQQCRINVEQ